jgi:hypothetical protein
MNGNTCTDPVVDVHQTPKLLHTIRTRGGKRLVLNTHLHALVSRG